MCTFENSNIIQFRLSCRAVKDPFDTPDPIVPYREVVAVNQCLLFKCFWMKNFPLIHLLIICRGQILPASVLLLILCLERRDQEIVRFVRINYSSYLHSSYNVCQHKSLKFVEFIGSPWWKTLQRDVIWTLDCFKKFEQCQFMNSIFFIHWEVFQFYYKFDYLQADMKWFYHGLQIQVQPNHCYIRCQKFSQQKLPLKLKG